MKRGEIWVANLYPSFKSEIGKSRPVLVIQNQALLDAGHPSVMVMAITTQLRDNFEPMRVRVKKRGKLKKDSDIMIDQVWTLDTSRLKEGAIAKLTEKEMDKVVACLNDLVD